MKGNMILNLTCSRTRNNISTDGDQVLSVIPPAHVALWVGVDVVVTQTRLLRCLKLPHVYRKKELLRNIWGL